MNATPEQMTALLAVLEERCRQVSKGYDTEHDATHTYGELAAAAACYASRAGGNPVRMFTAAYPFAGRFPPRDSNETARDDAVKAAALLLAEIERLDRLAHNEEPHP